MRQVISKAGLESYFSINKNDMEIACLYNKNTIVFHGLDDVGKLKSLTFVSGILTKIWIEEADQIDQDDFPMLDFRLRGKTKASFQIYLSLNPISTDHWIKSFFIDRKDKGVFTLKTTFKDNKFVDKEIKETFERYRLINPTYYKVYALGEWGELEEGEIGIFDSFENWPDERRVGWLDPAYSGGSRVALAVGCFFNDFIYSSGWSWNKHITDCYQNIVGIFNEYGLKEICVEVNADKGMSARALAEKGVRVREVHERENKHARIIQWLKGHKDKIKMLDSGQKEFMNEIRFYSEGIKPDDAPDALAGLVRKLLTEKKKFGVLKVRRSRK